MIADILTVMWKERKEQSGLQKTWRAKVVGALIPVLMLLLMGIVPPASVGAAWVSSPFPIVSSILMPLMVVSFSIPFAITGERERKTLETLLASRLPDQALFFGKIVPPVLRAWGVTLFVHLVSIIVVNMANWSGALLFYTPAVLFANLAMMVLLSLLAASLGVLIAVRAATVQQAVQNLMFVLMSPFILFTVFIILIGKVLPRTWEQKFATWFERVVLPADFLQVMLVILSVLLLLTLIVFALALNRFQRQRLYLD